MAIFFYTKEYNSKPIIVTNYPTLNPSPLNIQMEAMPPARLLIKAIGVDAKIEYVGLNSAGEMDVPTLLNDVAWYSLGTNPGQEGSAVIAGHFNGKNGEIGVFDSLDKLKINDEISVEDTVGNLSTFIVTKIEEYDYDADATKVFFSDEGSHLNLVSCAGDWNTTLQRYGKRLIVFTDIK